MTVQPHSAESLKEALEVANVGDAAQDLMVHAIANAVEVHGQPKEHLNPETLLRFTSAAAMVAMRSPCGEDMELVRRAGESLYRAGAELSLEADSKSVAERLVATSANDGIALPTLTRPQMKAIQGTAIVCAAELMSMLASMDDVHGRRHCERILFTTFGELVSRVMRAIGSEPTDAEANLRLAADVFSEAETWSDLEALGRRHGFTIHHGGAGNVVPVGTA